MLAKPEVIAGVMHQAAGLDEHGKHLKLPMVHYIASQKRNGWICLPERYDDGGFSGGNLDRPAFNRMKEDIIAGKIDMVVVCKLDRLSRSLLDFTSLQQFFETHGVSFCSVTHPIDTSTSAGRMMVNVLMSFGEYERLVIAERTRDKMAAGKKRGIWMGGYVPYGFFVKDKNLYAHPEEAPVVRRIFQRFTEIQSPKQIAHELNEDGIRPRMGKLWTSPYISRILANHTYVGEVLFKGEITKGEHDGIITGKVWDRVREITASQVPYDHSQDMAELTTPLKGILRCGHCGCAMKPVFTTKGNKRYCYYYCDQDTKRGEKTLPGRKNRFGNHRKCHSGRSQADFQITVLSGKDFRKDRIMYSGCPQDFLRQILG